MSTAARILDVLRPRAKRAALWMHAQWAADRTSPDQGLAITAGLVERILEAPGADGFVRHPEVTALDARIAAAEAALAADACWRALLENFGLTGAEANLLALCLAAALDPEFGRVIAYLHDDTRHTRATAWLAGMLFGTPAWQPLERLLAWHLVSAEADAAFPATAFQADPAVVGYVTAGEWRDAALDAVVVAHDAAGPVLYPEALAALPDASEGRVLCVDLIGAEGSGRLTLAAQFARQAGLGLLAVDAAGLTAPLAIAALRQARACNAVIFWRHGEALGAGLLPAELARAQPSIRAIAPETATRPGATVVRLPPLTRVLRAALWTHLSGVDMPDSVSSQRLTPGELALAAAAAPAGAEAVRLALRRAAPAGEILQRLECPYDWEDLVMPPAITAQLADFAAQIKLRWEVYEDWGFERLTHLGVGIAALFSGPSGTGKTMAAQVVARTLELDLYRVDLAGVINKYIGETEKKLRDVFAFGERAGAILFFDEADALFGSRTQVKDSHDRFANIEIDYLLQRIERFDGVTILASNRKADIDTAFLRRLRFVVDFVPPGPEERLKIWRKALPESAPSGERLLAGIDWEVLAGRLSLTGADIKSAALSAAFLARAGRQKITMPHVLAGVQRELAKRGQVLRWHGAEAAE
jgi:hypothetical protein